MPEERVAIQPPSVEWVPLDVGAEGADLDPREARRRVDREHSAKP
jgi:hypothetical protein